MSELIPASFRGVQFQVLKEDIYPRYTKEWYQHKHMFIKCHPIVVQALKEEIALLHRMDHSEDQTTPAREEAKRYLESLLNEMTAFL